ncbi:MAG: glycosyltransferase family 39 protein [Elusimicrobiota bacterium]
MKERPLAEAALALLALGIGLCGIGWGLPSPERLRHLLPADRIGDPELHRRMAEGRGELYQRLERGDRIPADLITEAVVIPRGWRLPPDRLLSSYRSYYLRSAYADEQKTLTFLSRMRPRELDFEPFGVDYGCAYLYPIGAYYAALAAVRALRVTSDVTVYFRDVRRMARIFMAGRLFNVLCFMGCVVLLCALGRSVGGRPVGLAAASFFLLSPVVCSMQHLLNPYGWAALWFLVACWRLQPYLEHGTRRDLLVAGAAVGLSVGSAFAYWPAALLLTAPLFRTSSSGRGWGQALLETAEAAAAAGVVFMATNPYLFLRFEKHVTQLVWILHNDPFTFSLAGLRAFLSEYLVLNWGHALTPAALFGVAWLLWRGEERSDRLFAAVFLFGLLHLAGREKVDFARGRYFLPFFALGALFAARVLWGPLARRSRGAAWALTALVLLSSGTISASYLHNFAREARGRSTQLRASRWIAENIPPGSTVGLVAPPQYSDTPPLRFDQYDIVLFAEERHLKGRSLPEFVVASAPRARERLADFLERYYEKAAAFEPERLLSWVPVHGKYTMANIEITVFQIRKEVNDP